MLCKVACQFDMHWVVCMTPKEPSQFSIVLIGHSWYNRCMCKKLEEAPF